MHTDYISCGRPFDITGQLAKAWMRKEFMVRLLNKEWPWPNQLVSQLQGSKLALP